MSPELAMLIGVVIGSVVSLLVTLINNKSEERKHIRSLIFQAGIEDFKESCEIARTSAKPSIITPMENHIINIAKFAKVLSKNPNPSEKELKELVKDAKKTQAILFELQD